MQNLAAIAPVDLSITIDEVLTEATGVLTSDNTQPDRGDKVTIGSRIYTMTDALGVAKKAHGTVTSDATNPDSGGTIVIGAKTYRFIDVLAQANDVLIGASAAATLDNLKSAVNATAGEGTVYGMGTTANATVEATTNTDTTQLLEARTAGAAGNAIVLTENATHITVTGSGTLYKGISADTADQVLIETDADTTLTNLKTLINAGRAAVAASGVLTSDNTNPADADEVVMGAKTYVFKDALTEAYATATLTASTGNPAVGEQVVVGDITYEFVDSLTVDRGHGQSDPLEIPNRVLIAANKDLTLENLVAAINGDAGEGEKYSYGTVANPKVSAAAVGSSATVMTARAIGVVGNDIAKSENSSNLDWDGVGATFTGGLDPVANEVKVGANANATLQNLKDAVNGTGTAGTQYATGTEASTEILAGDIDTDLHTLTVAARTAGGAGNALAKSETSSHLDWDGTDAYMTGGIEASAVHSQVTCGDVTAHAVTVTAVALGWDGNAVAKAEDSAHLDWDGTGAFLTGGGATTGTSEEIGQGGKLSVIVSECPQMTGSPTYTLSLIDTNGKTLYVSGNLNENAVTRTVVEQQVAPTDKVKILFSGVVENTLPVLVRLR